MVRTRNFKARNERIETGVLVKGQTGKNVSVERRMDECDQWKANGQCSRGESGSLRHGRIVDNRHNRPLLLQRRRDRLTEEDL